MLNQCTAAALGETRTRSACRGFRQLAYDRHYYRYHMTSITNTLTTLPNLPFACLVCSLYCVERWAISAARTRPTSVSWLREAADRAAETVTWHALLVCVTKVRVQLPPLMAWQLPS